MVLFVGLVLHGLRYFESHKPGHQDCKVKLARDRLHPSQGSGQRRGWRDVAKPDRCQGNETVIAEDVAVQPRRGILAARGRWYAKGAWASRINRRVYQAPDDAQKQITANRAENCVARYVFRKDGTEDSEQCEREEACREQVRSHEEHAAGGVTDRMTGYRQGGSLTAARNQWGYTAAAAVGGIAAGGVARVGGVAGIRGPGGNVVAAGRGAAFVNGQFVGGKAWTAVNGAYTRWGAFTPGWYGRYPGAWWPGKWALAATAWATWGWGTAGSYCGCSGEDGGQ